MCSTHLSHARALISAEASGYALRGWGDGGQRVSIGIFGIGSHAGNGQNLLVLLHSLLELPKENAQAWKVSIGGVVFGCDFSSYLPHSRSTRMTQRSR